MEECVFNIQGFSFYLNNPNDHVQRCMLRQGKIYEQIILEAINEYIPKNGVIIDAGAHIGTHSLYWARYTEAKSVYSFEPLQNIFQILKKNIELNHYEDVIHPFNMGLSSKIGSGSISAEVKNITALTQIKADKNGSIPLTSIDKFEEIKEKIDFIKIDTERHELQVLKGAKNRIKKDKPIIFVETSYETDKDVLDLLDSYHYKLIKTYPDEYCPWFYNRLMVYDK